MRAFKVLGDEGKQRQCTGEGRRLRREDGHLGVEISLVLFAESVFGLLCPAFVPRLSLFAYADAIDERIVRKCLTEALLGDGRKDRIVVCGDCGRQTLSEPMRSPSQGQMLSCLRWTA